MSKLLTLAALALGLSLPALAQTQILVQPDCRAAFAFTATGQRSFVIDNRQTGCTDWAITYNNVGFTALDIRLQSANVAAGGVPGTWGTFTGTLVSGANPNTATTEGSAHIIGYQPFVSGTLFSSTGTGQIQGYIYGCRIPGCAGSGPSVVITGVVDVQGPVAAGSPQTANPLPGGGTSPSGNAIALALDAAGDTIPANGSSANGDGVNNTNTSPTGNAAAVLYFRGLEYVFNGTTWDRLRGNTTGMSPANASSALADALSNTETSPTNAAGTNIFERDLLHVFNGTTWDRMRGNTLGTFAQGNAADGATAVGNPVQIGGVDQTGVARHLSVNPNGDIAVGTQSATADAQANNWAFLVTGQGGTQSPLATYPLKFNGATWDRQFTCPNRTNISLSAGTDVVIATGVSSQNVRLCQLAFNGATLADFTIRQGTGTTCLTNTADLAGIGQVLGLVSDFKSNDGTINTTVAARDMCLHSSVAVTILGWATYANF
jgi:hypothetical protein